MGIMEFFACIVVIIGAWYFLFHLPEERKNQESIRKFNEQYDKYLEKEKELKEFRDKYKL